MSRALPPITLISGTSQAVQLDNPIQIQALIITNKSTFDVQYSGYGTSGTRWLAAGTEYRIKSTLSSNLGALELTAFNTANLNPPPSSTLLVTEYFVDEPLPEGTWPVSIPAQVVNVPVVQQATSLVNTGFAPGTVIFFVQASGDTNVSNMTNDNKWNIGTAANPGDYKFANSLFEINQFGGINVSGAETILGTIISNIGAPGSSTLTARNTADNNDSVLISNIGKMVLGNPFTPRDGHIDMFIAGASVSGATSGTMVVRMPFQGSDFKLAWVYFNNYAPGVANQTVTLPVAFVNRALVYCPTGIGSNGIQFISASVAQSVHILTGLAVGGGTSTNATTFFSNSLANILGPCDSITALANSGAVTGGFVIIGS